MMNRELDVMAEQELGIVCWPKVSEKLSAIFQAWMRKHAELIDEMADYFYSKGNRGLDAPINFRDVLYELFLEDSREYDNHKWLVDNLK